MSITPLHDRMHGGQAWRTGQTERGGSRSHHQIATEQMHQRQGIQQVKPTHPVGDDAVTYNRVESFGISNLS